MKILFVDDSIERWEVFKASHSNAKWAATPADALALLEAESYDLIFLDHDMSEEDQMDALRKGGGQIIAQWIAENASAFSDTQIVIHSLNSHGAGSMYHTLIDAGIYASVMPFAWTFRWE